MAWRRGQKMAWRRRTGSVSIATNPLGPHSLEGHSAWLPFLGGYAGPVVQSRGTHPTSSLYLKEGDALGTALDRRAEAMGEVAGSEGRLERSVGSRGLLSVAREVCGSRGLWSGGQSGVDGALTYFEVESLDMPWS